MDVNITMASWVSGHAKRTPEKAALVFKGERISYAALDARVKQVAGGLREAGARKGDRVAALLLNCPELLVLLLACNHVGAIFLPINFRLSAEEVAFILNDATPEVFAYHTVFEPIAIKARSSTRVHTWLRVDDAPGKDERSWKSLYEGQPTKLLPEAVSSDDPAMMMYTSGTTGQPKGALLSHGNLLWNDVQVLLSVPAQDDDLNYCAAPLFHIGGLNVLTGPMVYRGGTTLIDDKFNPEATLETLAREKVTCSFMVPAMWGALAAVPDFDKYDLSSLRYSIVGGAPCPLTVLEFYKKRGIRFQEGFGLTETSPIVCLLAAEDGIRKNGSVGHPAAHVEVRIVDESDNDVPGGEPGELLVRAPNVMLGYWNRPEATREALRGGWFHTGDLARRDEEGFLYIVDRKKDMVITGGENVYSAEVEQVLYRHPAVAEVAVIGVPDERWGEAIVAVIATKEGEKSPTLEEMAAFCEGKLARYKKPRRVESVKALPRNATGKVLKNDLRVMFGGAKSAVKR